MAHTSIRVGCVLIIISTLCSLLVVVLFRILYYVYLVDMSPWSLPSRAAPSDQVDMVVVVEDPTAPSARADMAIEGRAKPSALAHMIIEGPGQAQCSG